MKKNGGGSTAGIKSFAVLVILVSIVFGVLKTNHIKNLNQGLGFFRAYTNYVIKCGLESAQWNCSAPHRDANGNYTSTINPKTGVDIGKIGNNLGGNTSKNGGGTSNNSNEENMAKNGRKSVSTALNGGISTTGVPNIPNPVKGSVSDKTILLNTLKNIKTANPTNDKTVNKDWNHWLGTPCDTRQSVLIRDAKNIFVKKTSDECSILSGKWVSPYEKDSSKASFTDPTQLAIDYIVPISYAEQHGAASWTVAKKTQFANDATNLTAVSPAVENAKKNQGPSSYMPENEDFQCRYAATWVSTTSKYDLTMTLQDKQEVEKIINKC